MKPQAPLPLVGRDYYTEFIEGSRWLRREQDAARSAWYQELPWQHKETTLFRFEMLLKGLVCFGNPVNYPGPLLRGEPASARKYDDQLRVVSAALREIVDCGRSLVGDAENSFVFQRYLESIIVQDQERIQLVKGSLAQDTPAQSLALLVAVMENLRELTQGLTETSPISFRVFSTIIQLAQREIHRSVYFDPLAVLEFRAEFDRIRSVDVLEVIRSATNDPARRVVSLVFLALFRLLRYLALITSEHERGAGVGAQFVLLALLRSDARALAVFLNRDAAGWMAEGFGRLFESADPAGIGERCERLDREFGQLKSLRELLGSLGKQLALELRQVYEQQLPALEQVTGKDDLDLAIGQAISAMRNFLQNTAVLLAQEFAGDISGEQLFADFSSARTRAERLRRDTWMFQQILRAFITKARDSVDAADQWTGLDTFHFVRDFVAYFKAMGYQLLRYSDYERFDRFIGLVNRLRDGDVLEVQRLTQVIAECEDFHSYLGHMFDAIGRRQELTGVAFDRREAAKTLMLFLRH